MNLPQVIKQQKSENQAEIKLAVEASLPAFEGHFDSAPIIPGVEQLRWVIEFAKLQFELAENIEIIRVDALKFQNVIQPDSQITLNLTLKEKRVDFAFTSNELRHSSGKVFIK